VGRSADKTDSYIAMVLELNGRVRPADLQAIGEESRAAALRAFAQEHGSERELHLAGEELVAGPPPDPLAAPVPPMVTQVFAPSQTRADHAESAGPADLTADGESAIDLLLGDYDGVPPVVLAPAAIAPSAPPVAPAVSDAAPEDAAPEAPRDTSRRWMLWWIPTLLLPVVGGAAAWFFLNRKRQFAARAMLTVGLVLGMLLSVAWLRYAEQIAAVTDQRAADKVIVLPDK
jgi:hypothetical protein